MMMLMLLCRKGTKSKQGAGHVWVLADEDSDSATVTIGFRRNRLTEFSRKIV